MKVNMVNMYISEIKEEIKGINESIRELHKELNVYNSSYEVAKELVKIYPNARLEEIYDFDGVCYQCYFNIEADLSKEEIHEEGIFLIHSYSEGSISLIAVKPINLMLNNKRKKIYCEIFNRNIYFDLDFKIKYNVDDNETDLIMKHDLINETAKAFYRLWKKDDRKLKFDMKSFPLPIRKKLQTLMTFS